MASPAVHGSRATADVLKGNGELPVRARTRGNGANPIQTGFHDLNLIGYSPVLGRASGATSGPGASPDTPMSSPFGRLLSDPPLDDAQSSDTDDALPTSALPQAQDRARVAPALGMLRPRVRLEGASAKLGPPQYKGMSLTEHKPSGPTLMIEGGAADQLAPPSLEAKSVVLPSASAPRATVNPGVPGAG